MKIFLVAVIFGILVLSGCLPEEPPVMQPPAVIIPPSRRVNTVTVRRGDVMHMARPTAQQISGLEATVLFPLGGYLIEELYVDLGDEVTEGDIILRVAMPDIIEEIEELESRRTRLIHGRNQLEERFELELRLAEQTGTPFDDLSFIYGRLDVDAELVVIEDRLATLYEIEATRWLYAPVSGTIVQLINFFEGMTTTPNSRIATISDRTEVFFMVRTTEREHMHIGDRFTVSLTILDADFIMEVVDPEVEGIPLRSEWGDARFLAFTSTPPAVPPNALGSVNIIFGEERDVLYIPIDTLHVNEDRSFVYIIEDGIRSLRMVEPGLFGNNFVEIRSGLEEGEEVIR